MNTTEEFIEKCQKKYGDTWDYSKTIYNGYQSNIIIICPIHKVEFIQKAGDHLRRPKLCPQYVLNKKQINFIEKAKKIHGDKFDYSQVIYITSTTKVKIICKIHGEFYQVPEKHFTSKYCCLKCVDNGRSTLEKFIEDAKKVHGEKYDYSHIDEYINCDTKVKILCPDHGEFDQSPYLHIRGAKCKECAINLRVSFNFNIKEFVKKAQKIHGEKYDYSKIIYVKYDTKMEIICPDHGSFYQVPYSHLSGSGCSTCAFDTRYERSNHSNTKEFIEKAIKIHGEKYDYSNVNYINSNSKVEIICPDHGRFYQIPYSHLQGKRCKGCAEDTRYERMFHSNTEEFIEKAIKIHGDKYDYSKVQYIRNKTNIKIICLTHGIFYQTPSSHLSGNNCIKCSGLYQPNTEEFIEKAIKYHGSDIYDYSKVQYVNAKQKIIVKCIKHNFEFSITPDGHLTKNQNCVKCLNVGYSKGQILWLTFMEKFYNISIQHVLNGGEYRIPTTRYKADGYCKETNTVYEYHGNFHHSNPRIYNPLDMNTLLKKTHGEVYAKTIARENEIRNLGYNLVIIWEDKWMKLNQSINKETTKKI